MTPPRIWKLGDNVDTDMIIPGRFLANWNSQPEKLRQHCLVDVLPDFGQQARDGDILVAGGNFGCGSSREAAPMSIKMAGISVIFAASFARIFYRNCLNIGLLAITSPEAYQGIREGDDIRLDQERGVVENLTRAESYFFAPFSPQVRELVRLGGMREYVLTRMAQRASGRV